MVLSRDSSFVNTAQMLLQDLRKLVCVSLNQDAISCSDVSVPESQEDNKMLMHMVTSGGAK